MPLSRLRRLQTRSGKRFGRSLCGCGETSSGFLTSKSRAGEQMPVLSTVVDELTQKLPKIVAADAHVGRTTRSLDRFLLPEPGFGAETARLPLGR